MRLTDWTAECATQRSDLTSLTVCGLDISDGIEQVQASVIVVLAANGNAARYLAKYRPVQPIVVGVVPRDRRESIGFYAKDSPGDQVARQCLLTRGLDPVVVGHKGKEETGPDAAKNCVMESIEYARRKGLVKSGDRVVSMYNVEKQCAVIRVVIVS
eukprot:CAMPEP_0114237158 /NCGR_PEP_ID=MMETSP0058-20121206/7234_1 /TAXON_ID=36894 /ORGANISM="Pyramimonas parkeae, CCMP726" /LENGTH=156 /DNA_ID=CAMNT_0001349167 /DNA_START=336 /DNA_END=807 /DNA_ORIENTATION=+